ncbi:hypothetical protein [Flavobacterium degerlachei]|jgi:translation elongation factor EF-Tu-like GTPase|uniref:Uncharacterized protein n=1 Tax=Flavobacterium degerlachei TaxID=229203 RepID=A0A1H2X4L6_9FLAO|nr:hypothetical protein [Flavobacterium degerlachei]SDW87853.1 hypothetical protein SAMN05444338_105145 [Flavobacterium degerlachei]
MQSTQLQIEKLNLIEKIIHIEDENLIKYLNAILLEDKNEYQLSEEQINIIQESRSKYLSGEDKGKTWDEVKSSLLKKRDERI